MEFLGTTITPGRNIKIKMDYHFLSMGCAVAPGCFIVRSILLSSATGSSPIPSFTFGMFFSYFIFSSSFSSSLSLSRSTSTSSSSSPFAYSLPLHNRLSGKNALAGDKKQNIRTSHTESFGGFLGFRASLSHCHFSPFLLYLG